MFALSAAEEIPIANDVLSISLGTGWLSQAG